MNLLRILATIESLSSRVRRFSLGLPHVVVVAEPLEVVEIVGPSPFEIPDVVELQGTRTVLGVPLVLASEFKFFFCLLSKSFPTLLACS